MAGMTGMAVRRVRGLRSAGGAAALAAGLGLSGAAWALEIVEAPEAQPVVAAAQAAVTPAQAQVQQLRPPAPAAFSVAAWVDRADVTYAVGDTLSMWVQTTQDAYVTVISVPAQGDPVVVFPNERQAENFLRANVARQVPAPGDPFRLTVGGPTGSGLIKVFATERPLDVTAGIPTRSAGAMRSLSVTPVEMASAVQAVLAGPQNAGRWTSYDKVYRIVERAAPQPAPAQPAPAVLDPGLRIAAARPVYRIGETVTLHVAAREDCHLTVTSLGADGRAVQVFPNAYQPSGFVRGGDTLSLPGAFGGYQLRAAGPEGPETLIARCEATPQVFAQAPGGGAFRSLDAAAARALAVEPVAGAAGPDRVATASFLVTR